MDTNDGRSDSNSLMACQSSRSPSAVFGGKNSKENVGCGPRMSSPIAGEAGSREGSPRDTP